MNLRNGKTTAVNNVATPTEREPTKERVKEFTQELRSLFDWVAQFEETPYGRVCAYCQLYEVVLPSIDEFKNVPTIKVLLNSIRDSAIRMLADLGRLTVKHGNDKEFMKAIMKLTNVLIAVLAKYAPP
jgi:hypothetical protein